MKALLFEELKKVELGILKYIDDICKDNDITYYLDGGTMLGAVRHNGFIPWDDDIDILVPRNDYEKLYNILKEDPRYRMIRCDNTEAYFLPYGKVCNVNTCIVESRKTKTETNYGVFVDVFPLDNYPDGKIRYFLYNMRLRYNRLLWAYAAYYVKPKNLKDILCNKLIKGKNARYYANKVDVLASKYKDCRTKYCLDILGAVRLNRKAKSEWFSNTIYLKFEGIDYPVPVGFDGYLKMLYGDYMILPPKEKQVTNHTFVAYMK